MADSFHYLFFARRSFSTMLFIIVTTYGGMRTQPAPSLDLRDLPLASIASDLFCQNPHIEQSTYLVSTRLWPPKALRLSSDLASIRLRS